MKKQLHTLLLILLSVYASHAQTFNNTYTTSDVAANKGTGKYTFFSFTSGEEVAVTDSATANWDIGFSGTTIIFNGGTKGPSTVAAQYVMPSTFSEITTAPTLAYTLTILSGAGSWYNYYSGATYAGPHTIIPIADKIVVVQLANGRYVKLQLLNYYQGAPTDVPTTGATYTGIGKYYSFKYTISDETSAFNDMQVTFDFAANKGTNKFSFFNFTTGAEVAVSDSATANWDIAFSGTTIIFNGGEKGPSTVAAQYVTSTYEDVVDAPTIGYSMNIVSGSGSWYNYYPGATYAGPHTIIPIADKMILVQLANGRYVKLQLLNYYQGAPDDVPTTGAPYTGIAKYYTFRYTLSENVEEPSTPTGVLTSHAKTISIYPNPISATQSNFTIGSVIDNGTVTVMDLIGNNVYRSIITESNMQVTNLNLAQGIYIVVLESNGVLYQQKLIVQ